MHHRSPIVLAGLAALATVALATSAPTLQAQTSQLYLTSGPTVAVVQHGSVLRFWSQPLTSEAIVTGITARTLGGPANGGLGYEYAPDGTATGTTFAHPGGPVGQVYDGASDGSHHYLVSAESQTVYRTDGDWSRPVALFGIQPTAAPRRALTYDPTADALWLGSFGSGVVQQLSMTGQLLRSFSTVPRFVTGLAFDRADGTLWMSGAAEANTLFQYALDGTLLQTVTFGVRELGTFHVVGGEFGPAAAVLTSPEPATVALLGAGLVAVGVAARRRRTR